MSGRWVLSAIIWGVAGFLIFVYHSRTLLRLRINLAPEPLSIRLPLSKAVPAETTTDQIEVAKGRLDFEAQQIEAYKSLGLVFEGIGQDSARFGKRMLKYGKQFLKTTDVNKRLKMASRFAKDIDQYTDRVVAYDEELGQTLDALNESVLPLVEENIEQQREGPEVIAGFQQTVSTFLATVRGARASTTLLQNSMAGLQSQSQDLNRATGPVVRVFDGLITNIKGLEDHCERVLEIIEAPAQA